MKTVTAIFIGGGKKSNHRKQYHYRNLRNDLKVMHISGSPGTGKTTLGEKLEKDFFPYLKVIDTDSFISEEEGNHLVSLYGENEEDYKEHWEQLYKDKFYQSYESVALYDESVKLLVYTGILLHWSYDKVPIDLPYVEYKQHNPGVPLQPPFLFFYLIPTSQLLIQYYNRELKFINANREYYDNEIVMKNPASDHAYLATTLERPFPSLAEYLKDHHDMINWHVDKGYEITGVDKILRVIKYYLGQVLGYMRSGNK